jgi:hypothetical protein
MGLSAGNRTFIVKCRYDAIYGLESPLERVMLPRLAVEAARIVQSVVCDGWDAAMIRKDTGKLCIGDVLGAPVTDERGSVLVMPGTSINADIVHRLERRGITEVYVRERGPLPDAQPAELSGDAPPAPAERTVKDKHTVMRIRQMEQHLRDVFGDHVNDPTMEALFEQSRTHLTNQILADKTPGGDVMRLASRPSSRRAPIAGEQV